MSGGVRLSVLIGAIVGMLICASAWKTYNDTSPIKIVKTVALNPTVTGRMFVVELKLENIHNCQGSVGRFLWRWETGLDGKPLKLLAWVRTPTIPIEEIEGERFQVMLWRPADLPPGEWHYGSKTSYSCSWLNWFIGPFVRTSPDLVLNFLPMKGGDG